MKKSVNDLFLRLGVAIRRSRVLPALIAGFALIPAGRVTAQTFTTLHSFPGPGVPYPTTLSTTNSEGAAPQAGLILSGNTLYGTAYTGGSSGRGTVFAINTDGTGFTNLHGFAGYPSDGANPQAGLVLSGDTLYGTANQGGSSGNGTVFAVKTNGTGFTTLHDFAGYPSESGYPVGGLILSGNTLYGTTFGTSSDRGTVFALNTDGSGFSALHSFTTPTIFFPSPINTDGVGPKAGLVLSGNTLYGTAQVGGSGGWGTVFAVNTGGSGFTVLHSFTATSGPRINNDGANTQAGLVLSGDTLYGTAWQGGSSGRGTVFAVNTDGTGFTILHSFTAPSGSAPSTNNDGADPRAGLVLSGNTLYGTTASGGGSGSGTVFAVKTDGTGFTSLHSFSAIRLNPGPYDNSDGASPRASLILSGNTLYGTTWWGGSSGNGTVFSLSLPSVSAPQLALASDGSGGYFIRAQGDPNFTCRLQRAPDLSGPWETIGTETAPASGLIEFHDINLLPGAAFYRTAQP